MEATALASSVTHEPLWQLAVTTLDHNWRHDHTVPSRTLYPHQWSWDAGFIAAGLARVSPARAWQDLRTLFSAQWSDGRVPHIVFARTDGHGDRYFPGPQFWTAHTLVPGPRPSRSRGRETAAPLPGEPVATSGIVQPPVHALAAWEVYRRAPDPAAVAQLRWLYPRLVAQQRYLSTHRNIGGGGLASLVHPWESGQDNSPAWDAALAAVPADTALLERYRRRDLAVSQESHRPTDNDYARYITIAQHYRSYGYVDNGPGERYPFLVECPAFNAILAAAEYALAEIAAVVGADPGPHRDRGRWITKALTDRLFDPATGMFHARDLYTGKLSPKRCIGGLVPLILPELPAAQVKSLLEEACSPRFGLAEDMRLPLPSYDRTALDLDPVRYWRGPIWINMNWLLWRGLREHGQAALAQALRRSMIDVVRAAGCYEYFHATTGAGVGTPEFSWTAALTLDLLASGGNE
jgi:mannosylglycerate hydrolase MGH1-like protein